ncbi:MAG TPA: aldolase/citrate lyase family protein [Alphaproteobacteria bacterium]|jgi:2-keto-3-deoxy-L-rhamnonate aldolase RhmA|nr:aldolase/citrate lyase family protein [Alphaproteobacteria bacterium]HJP20320.1 aldolase/citrate lyase family protein [Alphaproteobacteria bacterium]
MAEDLRQRLATGQVCYGAGVRLSRTPEIARIFRDCGFSWIFLDLEHGALDFDAIGQISCAAIEAGITPLVRVPDHDPTTINRVLSIGAMGVVVPHVDRAEQAAEVARHCRFPPQGARTSPGGFLQLGYRPHNSREAMDLLNRETLVVAMIESAEALENAEAIAATDGIDCLLVGCNDLAFDLGIPGQLADPQIEAGLRKVEQAATAAGKLAGIGGVGEAELLRRYQALGFTLVLAGNDLTLLVAGARAKLDQLGL